MASDPDCLFCKIVAGDIPAQVIDQDDKTLTFMDIAPATHGHALVIPREHARGIRDIDPQDLKAVHATAQRIAKRQERLGALGVNVLQSSGAAAWQTVFHFHVHVIPRYDGDPLKLPWEPREGHAEEIAAAAKELS